MDISIIIIFFLLRNIPQIPNKNKIIESARYFTKSIIIERFKLTAIVAFRQSFIINFIDKLRLQRTLTHFTFLRLCFRVKAKHLQPTKGLIQYL